jgi:hypothetical protein
VTIVKAVDSEYPPDHESLVLARNDGVVGWNGYIPGPNIGHGWTAADFDSVRSAGLQSIAYASGWMDPVAAKLEAALYGVRGCLDVEGGIRGDGPWVQGWLNASGFGLYGNMPVHPGRSAAFHVLAAYPGGDPGVSWNRSVRPPAPCGWQWQGTTARYGASVDLCWFDAAIYPSAPAPLPPNKPAKEIRMRVYSTPTSGLWFMCGALYAPIETTEDETRLLAVCGQAQPDEISERQHQSFRNNSAQPASSQP